MPVEVQQFNLAPFIDGKAVPLESWNNKVTRTERAEVKKLFPMVEEAVDNLHKEYRFTRLIKIFMKRRIQPLQVRPSTMWKYCGVQDASPMGRKYFVNKEALDSAIHSVIKGARTKELPSDCQVDPYGEGIKLPKVTFFEI